MSQEFLPCIYLSLRRAASALTYYYDKEMETLGISTNQFSIIINIKSAGEINMVNLAKILKLDKSTLTRTLAPLIDLGYVYSERGTNRREVILKLTETGEKKANEGFAVWRKIQQEMSEYLGGDESSKNFVSTLEKLQNLKIK